MCNSEIPMMESGFNSITVVCTRVWRYMLGRLTSPTPCDSKHQIHPTRDGRQELHGACAQAQESAWLSSDPLPHSRCSGVTTLPWSHELWRQMVTGPIPHGARITLNAFRSGFMGDCNREQSFAMLDTFFGLGGNFIDTYVL